MNRPWGLIYSLTGLVVLIGLSVLFLLRLNTAREANIADSEASYDRIISVLSGENDLISAGAVLDDYFAEVTTAAAVALYYPRQGMVFLRSRDSSVIRLTRTDLEEFEGFPLYEAGEVSWMLLREEASVGSESDSGLYLDVLYRIVSFEDVYPLLRDTLIALLAFAIVMIGIALIVGREKPTRLQTSPPKSTDGDEIESALDPRSESVLVTPDRTPAPQPLIVPETHTMHSESGTEPESAEIEVEEVTADEAPAGSLFDPITGLSYEQHLNKKLGLELERSAYNDQDLSCMIIAFDRSTSAEKRVELARHVLDAFQFEDLCFSFGERSFCVILPNTELPQAIRQATEFQMKYQPEAIGISARNGRLVEASRVLKETSRSLEHARTHPSRVVGFRPDPKKYRQFVSEQDS